MGSDVCSFMDVNWQYGDSRANPADAAIGPTGYDNHLYYSFGVRLPFLVPSVFLRMTSGYTGRGGRKRRSLPPKHLQPAARAGRRGTRRQPAVVRRVGPADAVCGDGRVLVQVGGRAEACVFAGQGMDRECFFPFFTCFVFPCLSFAAASCCSAALRACGSAPRARTEGEREEGERTNEREC